MKRIFLLFVIICFFSCKKNKEVRDLKNDVIGTWELEKSIGYPFNNPVFPPGNGRIIILGKDGSFERKQHDTLIFKGNYYLQQKDDCHPRETNIAFLTNESSFGYYDYIQIVDGKLTLSTPNCYADGGTSYYRRLE